MPFSVAQGRTALDVLVRSDVSFEKCVSNGVGGESQPVSVGCVREIIFPNNIGRALVAIQLHPRRDRKAAIEFEFRAISTIDIRTVAVKKQRTSRIPKTIRSSGGVKGGSIQVMAACVVGVTVERIIRNEAVCGRGRSR